MIKNVKQHKSCLRVQYSKEAGSNAVESIALPMLRASSLLITSGATLAEQKVHWMRSFEDIWKHIGVGAEALEPIVLDAEWYLNTQVRINPDKLLQSLEFPAGDYVIRRSTPADRLLVQLLPNLVLKTQHIQQLCQQLLYVQEEFSEVRFDIIEAEKSDTLGDKLSRDVGSSANYLETKPDALMKPAEPPVGSTEQPTVPTQPTPTQPAIPDKPKIVDESPEDYLPPADDNPEHWKGRPRPIAYYIEPILKLLHYEMGVLGYTGKTPYQVIGDKQYDALGYELNEANEIIPLEA